MRITIAILATVIFLLGLALLVSPFWEEPAMSEQELQKLITDVFAPQSNEVVAVVVDTPHDCFVDNQDWFSRREMAAEWLAACQKMGLPTLPLISYPATGVPNGVLPEFGYCDGKQVNLREKLMAAQIIIAMTTYSATAPLHELVAAKKGQLRAASMPGVLPRMEKTGLAIDHKALAQLAQVFQQKLEGAVGAEVCFSTGHKMYFDLRYREPKADDGICSTGKVINLPSGEAYIVPYEGERTVEPSLTAGEIPIAGDGETVVVKVSSNRIVEVVGVSQTAKALRERLAVDPVRCNIAEFGLGCNYKAVVTGVVLEDEKAGFHWAYGRSEHLGGTVGPGNFKDPANVLHIDTVYAKKSPIGVSSITIVYPKDRREVIMRDSEYLLEGVPLGR